MRKGVYKDGHERADVVKFRQEYFLPTLKAVENRMVKWELINTNEGEELQMVFSINLLMGVKPIVLLVHDESTFNANDGQSKILIKDDRIPLKKISRRM